MQRALLKLCVVASLILSMVTLAGCQTMKYLAAALEISRANTYYSRGNIEQAVDHIEKAVRIDPEGPWGEMAAYRLAEIYLEVGNAIQALQVFKRTLKDHPGHLSKRQWQAKLRIGECYERLDDPLEALEYYQKLATEEPGHSDEVMTRIGRVEGRLDRTGKRGEIEKVYREYKDYYRQHINIVSRNIVVFDPMLMELTLRKFKESYRKYKLLTKEMSKRERLELLQREASEVHQEYIDAIKDLLPEEYNRPDIDSLRRTWEDKQQEFEDLKRELEE